jgi:hypothetical protein
MSTYYLATQDGSNNFEPPPPRVLPQIPLLMLESMDKSVQIPLDGTTGFIRMPGATGLEMPTYDIVSGTLPGVAGALLTDVRVQERSIFIPIYNGANGDHLLHLSMKDQLRRLVDPTTSTFKLVGKTARGERELVVTYTGGLEGADGYDQSGLAWEKIGLTCTAHEPFARARNDRLLEFRMDLGGGPFLGVVGGTDSPWPTILSSGAVIGSGMEVQVNSDVPVYPTLELVGAMNSFHGELSPIVVEDDGVTIIENKEWLVDIPLGVAAGSTFRMVTDPRTRSIRLDGALAAGRVARGSTLRAFYPGLNVLSVVAPGGTEDTRIRLSWRELFRSLW